MRFEGLMLRAQSALGVLPANNRKARRCGRYMAGGYSASGTALDLSHRLLGARAERGSHGAVLEELVGAGGGGHDAAAVV